MIASNTSNHVASKYMHDIIEAMETADTRHLFIKNLHVGVTTLIIHGADEIYEDGNGTEEFIQVLMDIAEHCRTTIAFLHKERESPEHGTIYD